MHGICCGKPFEDDQQRIAWQLVPREEPRYIDQAFIDRQNDYYEERIRKVWEDSEKKMKEKTAKDEKRKTKGKEKSKSSDKEKKAMEKEASKDQ